MEKGKQMAKEFIEREAAINAIENDCLELVYYTKKMLYSVLKQPLPPMLSKWPDVGSANTATRMRYSEIAGAILI